MNCCICNEEMIWGNVYLKGSLLDFLNGYRERHLFFDAFNPQAKALKLIQWGNYREGFYCNNCGDVCLNAKDLSMKCIHCMDDMVYGNFHIRKSLFGEFVRNSLNHLYFTSKGDQMTLKILEGDFYVRGFYCEVCGTVWFNSKESKPD